MKTKKLIFAIFIFTFILTCIPVVSTASEVFAAEIAAEEKDIKVIVFVEPSLELKNAYAFTEGLAVVEKGGRYGLMDKTGYMVAPPLKYTSIFGFSEGLSGVQKGDGQWGFIDKTGELVIPFGYYWPPYFKDGLVRTERNGKDVYIDKTGKVVVTVSGQYYDTFTFNDGLARVYAGMGNNNSSTGYGYIDKTGELAIPVEYSQANDFSEGLACVSKNNWPIYKYGYIDTSGKMVIPFEYDMAYPFKEGLAVVSKGGEWTQDGYINGKYGYIDKTGKIVVPLEYDSAESFNEGFAVVSKDGKWRSAQDHKGYVNNFYSDAKYGYIDKTGKIIAPLIYESARDFSDGFAVVSGKVSPVEYTNIKYGYIDTTGKLVIPLQYIRAYDFSEGLACVSAAAPYENYSSVKCGYIDKKGRIVVPFEYDDNEHYVAYSSPFREGFALVRKDGKWGILKIFGIGDPIGEVLHSDIVAYINGNAIPTSVINGKTLVVVEDLLRYGFDVKWNNSDRTLKVELNKSKKITPLPVAKDTTHKPGTFKCKYLYTDIKTYLSGVEVESYAINGVTLIDFELLVKYGALNWDGKAREIKLTVK